MSVQEVSHHQEANTAPMNLHISDAESRAIFDFSPVGMAQVNARTGQFMLIYRHVWRTTP